MNPLTLGEQTVHQRVIERGDDTCWNPRSEQEQAQRGPVDDGAQPEHPDDAAENPGCRADQPARISANGEPGQEGERDQGRAPC